MPAKRVPTSTPSTPSSASPSTSSSTPSKSSKKQSSSSNASASSTSPTAILNNLVDAYNNHTPTRVKLIDVFLGFLVVVGVIQFAYCCLAGNYPFNAFLSGFSATVGQFVLTASLRIQTNPENAKEFAKVSDERAFADYVFGSLLLHFFCVNFIN
ncbi:MAG: oligosaccharyltransferase complex subunit epsilon [Piccolia ochrophora]|nr:MAG: oligosaccharyltransferase complex subunit epsilon [Piccolia ochrophora]